MYHCVKHQFSPGKPQFYTMCTRYVYTKCTEMKNTMCEMAGNGLLHARGLTYTKKGGKGGRKKEDEEKRRGDHCARPPEGSR